MKLLANDMPYGRVHGEMFFNKEHIDPDSHHQFCFFLLLFFVFFCFILFCLFCFVLFSFPYFIIIIIIVIIFDKI